MKLVANLIGYIGGCMLAVQNLPLLARIYKRKSAGDLSYHTIGYFLTGGGLTIAYGVLISAPPIYATLAFSWLVNLTVLCLKIKYDRHTATDTTTTFARV